MNVMIIICLIIMGISGSIRTQTVCPFSASCACTRQSDQSLNVACRFPFPSNFIIAPQRNLDSTETRINQMIITNYNFRTLPNNFFAGLTINSLQILNNRMDNITVGLFSSVVRLTSLVINEPNLLTVAPNSFRPLTNLLENLDMSNCGITNQRLLDLRENLMHVSSTLKSLYLASNLLTSFDPLISSVLPSLEDLRLNNNRINSISSDVFTNNLNLRILRLSDNQLNNFQQIITALEPVRPRLEILELRNNSIETLSPDFPSMPSLRTLALDSNRITTITDNTFRMLINLVNLNLARNQITSLSRNSFINLSSLQVLDLRNNLISIIPNIETLAQLRDLNLNNQQGRLTRIPEYSFHRITYTSLLTLNIGANDIIIENRGLCLNSLTNTVGLERLVASYFTIRSFNKCFFKQISSNQRITIQITDFESIADRSEVCNCNLRAAVNRFNINLVGACDFFTDSCITTLFVDDCSPTFDCVVLTTTLVTTSSITSTNPTTIPITTTPITAPTAETTKDAFRTVATTHSSILSTIQTTSKPSSTDKCDAIFCIIKELLGLIVVVLKFLMCLS